MEKKMDNEMETGNIWGIIGGNCPKPLINPENPETLCEFFPVGYYS